MVNFCDFDDSKPNPTNVCGITKVLVNGDRTMVSIIRSSVYYLGIVVMISGCSTQEILPNL